MWSTETVSEGLTESLARYCDTGLTLDTESELTNYLGHKNIQHTVRYTELASTRFRDFWKD